ncbi:hypothetical protein AMATHDRAFT_7975 [Amanita thiersii Skay4041]|uniref:Mid2 domain-containing protein n=1 Tax=Amanita thiersii Skay4041 TaxID=703135 RepID=A0A2A9NAG7_9AGAR|nr:hypothetical protein AMATHDRAFT_7975 [Amanita thiersii Skay4041]
MLLLHFLNIALYSAFIFSPTFAILINRTFDDTHGDEVTGIKPVFQPRMWVQQNSENGIKPDPELAFNGTWTAAFSHFGLTVTLKFNCVVIYVFFILAENLTTECGFDLDGKRLAASDNFLHLDQPYASSRKFQVSISPTTGPTTGPGQATPSPAPPGGNSSPSRTGLIIGAVVAPATVLLLLAIILYILKKRRARVIAAGPLPRFDHTVFGISRPAPRRAIPGTEVEAGIVHNPNFLAPLPQTKLALLDDNEGYEDAGIASLEMSGQREAGDSLIRSSSILPDNSFEVRIQGQEEMCEQLRLIREQVEQLSAQQRLALMSGLLVGSPPTYVSASQAT